MKLQREYSVFQLGDMKYIRNCYWILNVNANRTLFCKHNYARNPKIFLFMGNVIHIVMFCKHENATVLSPP